MHQRTSDSQPPEDGRVGLADAASSPLSSLPLGREGKGRKVKKSFELDEGIVAWLDAKPRGEKTRIIEAALRAAMSLEATPEQQRRLLLAAKQAELERLVGEVRLLQSSLEQFDLEANREAAWRDEIRLYLTCADRPSRPAQEAWARARRIPADTYWRLAEEVQRGP